MDILIKNVELPRTVTIYPNGDIDELVDGEYVTIGKAIELPPHGRLVSADEVQKKMTYYGFRAIDMTIHEFVEDELTTVLEAST